jgi:hypothetical protein
MSQSELFRADGATFSPVHDGKRLSRQLDRVAAIMSDGVWRTLRGIAVQAGGSEASVSARLRDLRKARFGGHVVERRRRGEPSSGVWEYRLLPVVRQ